MTQGNTDKQKCPAPISRTDKRRLGKMIRGCTSVDSLKSIAGKIPRQLEKVFLRYMLNLAKDPDDLRTVICYAWQNKWYIRRAKGKLRRTESQFEYAC